MCVHVREGEGGRGGGAESGPLKKWYLTHTQGIKFPTMDAVNNFTKGSLGAIRGTNLEDGRGPDQQTSVGPVTDAHSNIYIVITMFLCAFNVF